jgi:retinol dehydrogenase-13
MRSKFSQVDCSYMLCDVGERSQVKQLAASLGDTPVDILVNNAAVTPKTRAETKDGIEQQWACNVLGYHWLMQELEPNLLRCGKPPARVVNVASSYAGGLDLADPEFKRRPYDADAAYRASKQANRMLTRAWADRWPRDRIVALSCHPGVATSAVSLGLGFDMDRSAAAARAGAAEPLRLCAAPAPPELSGGYFRDGRQQECAFSADADAVRRLMGVLESYP